MSQPVVDDWQEKGPPWTILLVATFAVVAAFGLLVYTEFASHIAGYILGSIVCTALVVFFGKVDARRRAAPNVVYLNSGATRYIWSGVLLAGIIASGVHAWFIATILAVR